MLKGNRPLLTPDLLRLLADMGHDDALVLADANFTASWPPKPVLRLPGISVARWAVRAVDSVLPLAADVDHRWPSCMARNRLTCRRCSAGAGPAAAQPVAAPAPGAI